MSEHGSRLVGSRLGSELDPQMVEKSEKLLVEKVQHSTSLSSRLSCLSFSPPARSSVRRSLCLSLRMYAGA